ncbi:LysR substrate-binding domain-containing protein [Ruegeria sp. 1NDH52C]|uniref:LysR substrate-binding domain-containing protein n=1 Tax=Ruegeria alba TaxID=2916756 RepID=A0ABS9NRQ7_9RHOB|nr:LysR substrate-binding domain-containing protein [Ruegeria alba]MCG6556910.1 LysR substrate-binding domain-containing protein [Ruegeria alba]
MATRIPTLTSLRAFEAVARFRSFRKAADELHVTHAAVSHQIKTLEQTVGIQLFVRNSRSVELTPAGAQYYPSIREHIQGIMDATQRLQAPDEANVLRVQSYNSFNTMWLQPRLADFLQDNPTIRVRIISSFEDGNYDIHRFDVGVFNAPPFDPRYDYRFLFETDIFPVCAPGWAVTQEGSADLALLETADLLSVPNTGNVADWDCWLRHVGLNPETMTYGSVFDHYPLVREAVLNGKGIGIARAPFVDRDLASGRLLKPFAQTVPEPLPWFVATKKEGKPNPSVTLFVDWLVAEMGADPTVRSTQTSA